MVGEGGEGEKDRHLECAGHIVARSVGHISSAPHCLPTINSAHEHRHAGHCPFTLLTLLLPSHPQVASYMRGVLRTLAVMHSHHILHRDIKPSNFMLLNDSERAPLKAIDFGLAMPYEPEALPLSHLGLEGTPW